MSKMVQIATMKPPRLCALLILLFFIPQNSALVKRIKAKPKQTGVANGSNSPESSFSSGECVNVWSERVCEATISQYENIFQKTDDMNVNRNRKLGSVDVVPNRRTSHALCCFLLQVDEIRTNCCSDLRRMCEMKNSQCYAKSKTNGGVVKDAKKKKKKNETENGGKARRKV